MFLQLTVRVAKKKIKIIRNEKTVYAHRAMRTQGLYKYRFASDYDFNEGAFPDYYEYSGANEFNTEGAEFERRQLEVFVVRLRE